MPTGFCHMLHQEAANLTEQRLYLRLGKRLERERGKFSDYDDLKMKAGEKATADERIADLEQKYAAAEARALRASIANEHGISPEDRDLFLTGTDEETLTAQAKRLADRESERKRSNNHVPNEGKTPKPTDSGDERQFVNELFGRALSE